MTALKKIYLIGSLRNAYIPELAIKLRSIGFEVFDDWHSVGPDCDDAWQEYEQKRGRSYKEALSGHHARDVFEFDKYHLDTADIAVLVMPAGKSGHLEAGYMARSGKPTYVLFNGGMPKTLSSNWNWLAGLYEGEGSITRNGKRAGHGLKLQLNSTDYDVIKRAADLAGGYVYGPYKQVGANLIKKGDFKVQWRWSVHKKEEILRIIGGIWEDLGARRKVQIKKALSAAGISLEELEEYTPLESRFDIMYQLCTDVFFSEADLIETLLS